MRRPFRVRGLLGLAVAGLIFGGLALWGWLRSVSPSVRVLRGREGPIALHRLGPAQWRVEAASPLDEAFAEGMLDGWDAAPLLLVRRAAAEGRLQALMGPEAAPADAWVRHVDLPARVEAAWNRLDEATRARLQAYAEGVNAAWRNGLPWSGRLLPSDAFARPWRPQDSLAVAAGLALAHPGWMEAEIAAALRPLPEPLRASLIDPRWKAATPVSDASARETVWRIWAAAGAAPEIGLFRGCQDETGFRLHAMAAPVLPLPWRAAWVGETLRLRWPGIPGALARIAPSGGRWLGPEPGFADPLDRLEELVRGILAEEAPSALWIWTASSGEWPACSAARAGHREALLALTPQGWLQRRVHGMLQRWDGSMGAKSPSALVYAAWREEVLRLALGDELGERGMRSLRSRRSAEVVLTALLAGEVKGGGDPVALAQGGREQMLQEAYRRALRGIGRRYGDLHTIWEWGKAHAASLRILGWPLRAEIAVGGDEQDRWPTPMDPARPYRTAFWPALTVRSGPEVNVETAPVPWWWPWP
ncbi:penicillin acylase family protein [Thermoflexus sp.]|uniref:penicillin acylase family protein n=1 Tax=Thermoflexus sp. TaxID=1969742 RepID=UPI002ADE0C9D|nr:penicillin acylase family protein [Thermoflexus sp.]